MARLPPPDSSYSTATKILAFGAVGRAQNKAGQTERLSRP